MDEKRLAEIRERIQKHPQMQGQHWQDIRALLAEIEHLKADLFNARADVPPMFDRDLAINTLKLAYRKHWLDDDSIGWEELGDKLMNALAELMGDKEYVKWMGGEKDRAK
jgi:hypothetical protein